ncbi:hypothetical protein BJV82DRAFT_624128 [Fennellomyces sp. T-0311]|nr:hypothetical protein BJV82DRAFT_624128 [Fennellomyces sp. T-0311]
MLKIYISFILFLLITAFCFADESGLTGDTPPSTEMKPADIAPPVAANPNPPAEAPLAQPEEEKKQEQPSVSGEQQPVPATNEQQPVPATNEQQPVPATNEQQPAPATDEQQQQSTPPPPNSREAAAQDPAITGAAVKNPLVKIEDDDDFCFFLPPQPNVEVAPTEDWGVPYCTSKSVVKGNKLFPDGFITKAHYYKNSRYTQVTGYMDPEKFGLIPTDEGGQYDNHHKGKPIGAQCKGYKYFVNLLEPADYRFCIRCCDYKEDCNTGISQYGCIRVIDGDYSYDELVNDVFHTIIEQEHHMERVSPSLQEQVNRLFDLSKDPSTPPKQMKHEWEVFIDHLVETYPSEQHMLFRASQTTLWFKETSQWWYFLSKLVLEVHQDEQGAN